MYGNNDRMYSFLTLLAILGFVVLAVSWLTEGIGREYTTLVIFALVGILIFAGGGLFAYSIQRITLDSIARFNGSDAQIDRYRQATFKEIARGDTAERRAAAQIGVIDARRVDQLAQQRARLLTETQQQSQQENADLWAWEDDDNDAQIQQWR